MRKFVILIVCIFAIGLISCSKTPQKNICNDNINNLVAIELEKIDNNYSDETLKALSVIVRTNLIINNVNAENKLASEKYQNIANLTKNETLKNNNNNYIEISINQNEEEYHWQKNLKKSKILEFALKNKINLTNISDIDPIIENDKVVGLNIANKYFDYNILAKEFGLESNVIENIENNKSEIIIKGKNKGFYDSFNIKKSEQLSNNNYNYKDILNSFFNDLKINKI